MYLLQQHLEAKVAAPLLEGLEVLKDPALFEENYEGSDPDTPEARRAVAQWRLAHAFLGKGAERGLCTVSEDREELV